MRQKGLETMVSCTIYSQTSDLLCRTLLRFVSCQLLECNRISFGELCPLDNKCWQGFYLLLTLSILDPMLQKVFHLQLIRTEEERLIQNLVSAKEPSLHTFLLFPYRLR
jgi:hypothetical protein